MNSKNIIFIAMFNDYYKCLHSGFVFEQCLIHSCLPDRMPSIFSQDFFFRAIRSKKMTIFLYVSVFNLRICT